MNTLKLLVVFALTTILATGCATDKAVISQASQTNQQLDPAFVTDPQVVAYFGQIGDRIIAAAKELDAQGYGPKSHKSNDNSWMFTKDIKFHLVNSKTLNAFTTGGDHVYVYNSLFQMCKDENELASVMSHEYGHIYCRHVAKGMNRQYGVYAAMLAAAGGGYLLGGKENGAQYAAVGAGAGGAAAQFLNMGFTRDDEAQADEVGFAFYTHAGWDPNEFSAFFQDMINAGYDKTPAIASDHPTLASRVEAANKRVKALPPEAAQWRKPPIADVAQFRALQQRANAAAAHTPSDQQLANSQQLLQALPRSCIIPYTPKDEVEARQAVAQRAQSGQTTSTSKKKKHSDSGS